MAGNLHSSSCQPPWWWKRVVEEMLGGPLSPGCPSADHQPCWRDASPSPTGAIARMQPTLPSAWDGGMRAVVVLDQCRRSQR